MNVIFPKVIKLVKKRGNAWIVYTLTYSNGQGTYNLSVYRRSNQQSIGARWRDGRPLYGVKHDRREAAMILRGAHNSTKRGINGTAN